MTPFSAIKLKFNSPLHLSMGGFDYDESLQWLPSDTLSAALVACAVQVSESSMSNEEVEDFLCGFQVSSAFPFFGEEYFFPKPLLDGLQIDDPDERKAEKQVVWYGKSWFEKWLNDSRDQFNVSKLSENHRFLSDVAAARDTVFMKTNVEQRVVVPRTGDSEEADANTFYQERVYFEKGAGLFFLFEIKEEKWRTLFEAALRLLGDNGIGTDRTTGNGCFDFEKTMLQFNLPNPTTAQTHIALSLFCPKKEEIDTKMLLSSGYQLIKRGGYLASPSNENWTAWRKRSVWMFREGSVFPASMKGKFVDLQPSILKNQASAHPVWRDGRGFFV
ncbi:MAG: type III-A CRISPR-associated RAMP protein Csm4 [Saprospiraceae bacterium]|nr:type III-A CRISPR-associated RAMP protein Csm4 [Saprospiraceae bacterium]